MSVLLKCHHDETEDVYITAKGRANFIILHKLWAKKGSDNTPKRVVSMIFPPEADLTLLNKIAIKTAKDNGFTVKTFLNGEVVVEVTEKGKKKKVTINSPFIDADAKLADVTSKGEAVDLEGWKMLRCSTTRVVKVRDKSGDLIDEDDIETEAYSGRWLRLMVRPLWYDVDGNKGVSFGLEGAQLLGHDDPIGGSGAPVSGEGFGAVDDEDDDEV